MAIRELTEAKRAKKDEFYTQYQVIEKEVSAYLEYDPDVFRGKTVLLPCDDPEWSNFTKYFAQNFEYFGLKKLISTSYAVNSKKYKGYYQPTLFETNSSEYDDVKTVNNGKIFTLTHDKTGDNKINVDDLEWHYLEGDGDFRSDEIKRLRDEADMIITNPPFSLFREFLAWIIERENDFLIIGNMNAITYKEVFPLIKENKLWLGPSISSGDREFQVPDNYPLNAAGWRVDESGRKFLRIKGVRWFTNLDHGRRHQPLQLMSLADNRKFNKRLKGKPAYVHYDNYDAIEVPVTNAIPNDFDGVMGVPISFLDKYSPEQFEILGTSDNGLVDDKFKKTQGVTKEFVNDYYKAGGTGAYKEGNPTAGYYENNVAKMAYKRIFIKHKKK
jgi:hypothetical protein